MKLAMRAALGRCSVCGLRCDAWLCVGCSFNTADWDARQVDDRRSATATVVSMSQQRREIGERIEPNHKGATLSIEEQRRWSKAVDKINPAYRQLRERTAALQHWSRRRRAA